MDQTFHVSFVIDDSFHLEEEVQVLELLLNLTTSSITVSYKS